MRCQFRGLTVVGVASGRRGGRANVTVPAEPLFGMNVARINMNYFEIHE